MKNLLRNYWRVEKVTRTHSTFVGLLSHYGQNETGTSIIRLTKQELVLYRLNKRTSIIRLNKQELVLLG